jgi:His-Xaa-Ser system radical SAM maturase HxsB
MTAGARPDPVGLPVLDPERLGWFRFGRIGGRNLLTNDVGEWSMLGDADFADLLAGRIGPTNPLHAELARKAFVREGADPGALAVRLRRKRSFLGRGPHLGIVVTTLRCNQHCRYCQVSRAEMDRVDTDMSLATAKRVVDHILQTPSPYLAIEFQGGEPTVNWDVLRFVVEYSREKNRYEKKTLEHLLVTNLTTMDDAKADWLVANRVQVCTSLDGPADVHDWNRPFTKGGSSHAHVVDWMRRFREKYVAAGMDPRLWHVDALMTTTRKSLDHGRAIVDTYIDLGIRGLNLRPLQRLGFAQATWERIGYSTDEFLRFYEDALDYVIAKNKDGVEIQEGVAAVFLVKMLTPDDPGFVDIRSPIGSGTGQLTYDHDGRIYTSDEGRMVAAMGDRAFCVGDVEATSFAEATQHGTVKALAAASFLDGLPMCADCWNAPYCGVRPLHNYVLGGDLFGQRPNTSKCKEHMGIARMLFERLDRDPEVESIFRRWTQSRPRTETVDAGAAPGHVSA